MGKKNLFSALYYTQKVAHLHSQCEKQNIKTFKREYWGLSLQLATGRDSFLTQHAESISVEKEMNTFELLRVDSSQSA